VKPYSTDLRQRVLADCDAGAGTNAVARKYSVSPSWVRKLKQQRRETGSIEPRVATPGPKPALAAHHDRLRQLVQQTPGLTAGEYRKRLGVPVAVVTVWRAIRRLDFTHKKSPAGGRTGSARGRRATAGVAG
jgi:transposase